MKVGDCIKEFDIGMGGINYLIDTFCLLEKYGERVEYDDEIKRLVDNAVDSDYLSVGLTYPVGLYEVDDGTTVAVVEIGTFEYVYVLPYDLSDVVSIFTPKLVTPTKSYYVWIDSSYNCLIEDAETKELITDRDEKYKDLFSELRRVFDKIEVYVGL